MNNLLTSALPWVRDRETGRRVRRVSVHETINHHPFFYVPAYDEHGRWLFFISHETGQPQIYGLIRSEDRIVQLTNCADLNEWSIHPSGDGRYIYYTRGSRACRVDLESLREESLYNFGAMPMLANSMVGAGMGVTSLSSDGLWWAIPVRGGTCGRLFVINTATGVADCIYEAESLFHPQFHPDDAALLHYSSSHTNRMCVIERNGNGNRPVYERDASRKEWVVHETWIPGSRDLLAVDWPRGLFRVSIDDGVRTDVSKLNAWHPTPDRVGSRIVADTRNPDRGICILNLGDAGDTYEVVGLPRATNRGDHWDSPHCPYDDGPVKVDAPQHTHPHPSFSPDGRYIVYTSDSSGWPMVYEIDLGEE